MKSTIFVVLLAICSTVCAQTKTTISEAERRAEASLGQLEEIAMCHHAIKAAYYDGLSLNQNPYYRYIVYSPHKNNGANVYPIPERCKTLETSWILNYTNLSTDAKALQDKSTHDAVGMTIPDIATDAQFLTIVIDKMTVEGDQAVFWENRDKDIF
jgi:hypothetical protein